MSTEATVAANESADLDAANAAASAGGSNDVSGSSPGEGAAGEPATPEAPKSPLEAVKAALEKTAEEANPQRNAADADAKGTRAAGQEIEKPDGESDEDPSTWKNLPFNSHPRFRQLLKINKEQTERASGFEDKANRLDSLAQHVNEMGLSAPEYDTALNLAAHAKRAYDTNDAVAAAKLIPHFQTMIERLSHVAGVSFPEDIRGRVDDGSLSEDDARELAQSRLQQQTTQRTLNAEREAALQREDARHRDEVAQVTGSIEKAAAAWETQWAGSDPDYKIMKLPVQYRIVHEIEELAKAGNGPRTAAEVVTIANRVRADLKREMGRDVQGTRTTTRVTAGGSPNGSSRPVPKTPLDVVRLALSGG